MNVFCEQIDTCTVVKVEGDIVVPETDQLKEFLLERIDGGRHDLILDFTTVPYMDSSAISVLLTLLQAARRHGGDVRLVGINDRISELFEQVGLQHIFRLFEGRKEAIASFQEASRPEIAG